MQPSKAGEVREIVCKAFREVVEAALLEVSTLEWQVNLGEESPVETPDLSQAAVFRFRCDGASSGEVLVGVQFDLLPKFAFRDAQDDAPESTQVKTSLLLTALEGRRSQLERALAGAGTVTVHVALTDGAAITDHEVMELRCSPKSEGDVSSFPIFVCVSPKLIADLQHRAAEPFVFPHIPEMAETNLDLVMDVELNVTLRFGQRQLALREVLELTSGSVVELDRQVDEPIELILDGRVVARGEAVIIDGNYGMRVTQVLQPMLA